MTACGMNLALSWLVSEYCGSGGGGCGRAGKGISTTSVSATFSLGTTTSSLTCGGGGAVVVAGSNSSLNI